MPAPHIYYTVAQKSRSQDLVVDIQAVGFTPREYRVAVADDVTNRPQVTLRHKESINPAWAWYVSTPAGTAAPSRGSGSGGSGGGAAPAATRTWNQQGVLWPSTESGPVGTVTIPKVPVGQKVVFIQAIPEDAAMEPVSEIVRFSVLTAWWDSWETYFLCAVVILLYVAVVVFGFYGALSYSGGDDAKKAAAWVSATLGAFPPFILLEAVPIVLGFVGRK